MSEPHALSEQTDAGTRGSATARSAAIRRHFKAGGLANDTAWGSAHDVSQMLLQIITFLVLSRKLGVTRYGQYAGIYGIVGPLNGLTWSATMLAVLQRRLRDEVPTERTSRDFFGFTLVLVSVGAVVGALLGRVWIDNVAFVAIAAIMIAEMIGIGLINVGAAMVQANQGFAYAARLRMVILAIRLTVLLSLASIDHLTLVTLGIGYAIGFLAYTAVMVVHILPGRGIPVLWGRPDKAVFHTSALLAVPLGTGVLQQDGDKVVLNAQGFQHDAGVYAAAFRVVGMGLMPLRALESAAFQRFLPHNDSERNQHVRRAARYSVLALGISVLLGLGIMLARPLLPWVLGHAFDESERIVPWLLPFLPLTAVSNAPSNGLLGLGRLGVRLGIYATGALVSVTTYIVAIPRFDDHWKGAVLGTIVGESFLAIAGWIALLHFQGRHNRELDERIQTESTPSLTA
ncbi:MAG: lipopolysaccharide biosynthesis protein [Microthrixaceae bacterium]